MKINWSDGSTAKCNLLHSWSRVPRARVYARMYARACIYACMNVCVRVRASKREISGPRPRQTPKLCFTADSQFTFFLASYSRLFPRNGSRNARAASDAPIRHRYHFFFPLPSPPLPSIHLCHFCQLTFNRAKTKKKERKKIFLLSRRDVTCCVSTRRRRLRRLYAWSGASDSEFKLFYPWIANKLTAWHLWYYYVITAATRRDVPSLCLSLSPSFFFSFSLCRLLIYRILLRRVTLKGRPL